MEINDCNKQIYEKAFILNGEYALHTPTWKPDIDERNIEESCEGPDGKWVPATPLGYRDYSISRLEGLKNILEQTLPVIEFSDESFREIKCADNKLQKYDHIRIYESHYIVVGDSENCYYIVDREGNQFYVDYEGCKTTI